MKRSLRPRSASKPSSHAAGSSRHNPSRAAKHRTGTYTLPDSDSDPDTDFNSNRDEDEDERPSLEDHVEDEDNENSRKRVKTAKMHQRLSSRRSPKTGRPNTRQASKEMVRQSPRRRSDPHSRKLPDSTDEAKPESPSYTMDLQSLPYLVLMEIFNSVTNDLHRDPSDARWLVDVACLCKAFAESALAVLYRSPPLITPARAHRFIDLLLKPRESLMYSYRHKVKSLVLNIGAVAAPTWHKKRLDLEPLLANLPRLQHINFYHEKDMSPYRQLQDNIRWVYPPSLFSGLGPSVPSSPSGLDIPVGDEGRWGLLSFHWSGRTMGNVIKVEDLKPIHKNPPFQTLRRVHLVNFQSPTFKNVKNDDVEEMDIKYAQGLAAALTSLPELGHVVLESSTVVNGLFVSLLPTNLKVLELINCWEIKAEEFGDFLLTHGQHLEKLYLYHNQALSLSFLPLLAEACPALQELRVDLNYFRYYNTAHDADPFYDDLMGEDDVPQWPTTLRVIEIENMRQWDSDTAKMFFKSLVENAPFMPMLRQLSIKARLTVSWRERSAIRDLWVDKLRKVYLRPWKEPLPYKSLKDLRRDVDLESAISKGQTTPPTKGKGSRKRSSTDRKRVSYKDPDTDSDEFDTDGDVTMSAPAPAKTTRASGATVPPVVTGGGDDGSESEPDSDLSELSDMLGQDEMSVDAKLDEKPVFIHGKCDIVDITIDNQKPVENQFLMEDFLDEDSASDGSEWDGRDSGDFDGGGYAW